MNATLPADLCGIIIAYSTPIFVCDYDKSIKLLQDICQTNKYDDKMRIHYSSSGAAYKIYEIIGGTSIAKLINKIIDGCTDLMPIKVKKIEFGDQILKIHGQYGYISRFDSYPYDYDYNQEYKCWIYTSEISCTSKYSVLIIEKCRG